MYKKGAGNDKQGKDAGNRTLCPKRNFSQAIMTEESPKIKLCSVKVLKRYLNKENLIHGRQTTTISKFSALICLLFYKVCVLALLSFLFFTFFTFIHLKLLKAVPLILLLFCIPKKEVLEPFLWNRKL